ncbi:MAG: histidine phosphatase family protein [Rhodobacteraceae bacterium]|nr:histidine phosphatase family protein [Paracoccaceae bacterium]
MAELALLRHGHTSWNREGRLQGRRDIPLDDEARHALSALQLPADWADADLVSSPLKRACETAAIVAGRAPVPVAPLIEMDWGDWEGKSGRDLREDPKSGYTDIEHWGWSMQPPGGEALSDVRDRVVPWAMALTRRTIAVCHIGIMRVLLAHAFDWDFTGTPPFAVKRNRLYVLEPAAGGLTRGGKIVPLEAAC